MIKKFCDKCGKFSYSSSCIGKWVCPSCGHDITKNPSLAIDDDDIYIS